MVNLNTNVARDFLSLHRFHFVMRVHRFIASIFPKRIAARRKFGAFISQSLVLLGLQLSLSGSVLAAPQYAQGVTDNEILIGAFGPLAGPAAWIGLSARDGLNLAVNELNANGGINGRKLRLLFEGAETPAASIAAAKKLVEENKVFAVIIGAGSTGAAAAADYLRESGIPTYNIVAATPKIRDPFGSNIFHGVYPHAGLIAKAFAQEINQTKPGKVSILVGTYEFPQAVYQGLIPQLKQLGIEVVSTHPFDLGTKDFTAQLISTSRDKPDAIVFLGNSAEASLAIKQAPELGITQLPWIIDLAGISRALPQIAGPSSEGVRSIWMFPYFHDEQAQPMAEFDQKWRTAYGQPAAGRPSYIDINGYGDLYVLAVALREAGDNLTWDNLIARWEQLRDVKPSDFGSFASDVIFPETFSPTDRDGNKRYSSIIVKDGVWQVSSKP